MEPKQPSVRAGVLSLNINSKSALYAAYMPFMKGGGLFIPTNRNYASGDDVSLTVYAPSGAPVATERAR